MALLTVAHLQKSFNGRPAVKDVSFSVKEGDVLGLLGPNGAGKTTAIRSVLGIYEPDGGDIQFAPGVHLDHVGYLPEERGLYPDAPVLDCLVYLAALKNVPKARARQRALEWLEKVDLVDYAHQKIETLSKGMQQKVQFVAAVIHEPKVAILDEVFSGLDPVNQESMIDLIHELKRQGTTLLVSSHQINLVEALCDRIILVESGEVILQGEVEQVKRAHGMRIAKVGYSGEGGFLTQLPGVTVASSTPGRFVLHLDERWTPEKFMQQLMGRIDIEDFSISWPPLHDVFVSAVKARREVAS